MLLFADVLKSVSRCTSLLQDSLLGLLSTGDGGGTTASVDAERVGIVVLFAAILSPVVLLSMWNEEQ